MEKRVEVGSKVTVEIYLGRVTLDRSKSRTPFLIYERFRGEEDYTETLEIVKEVGSRKVSEISYDSFIGRVLMGATVGQEVEVNVGGLSVNQLRAGFLSGNHQKLKIISIK